MTATNSDQFEILVEFMETNSGIAKNLLNSLQYRDTTNKLWNNLKERLNSAGPPEKNVDGWKKVWRGFKYNVKNKIRWNKKSVSGTGGGPCRIKRLTNLEERVDVLLDLRGEIEGINANSFGCKPQSNQTSINNSGIETIPTSSTSNSRPQISIITEENEEPPTIQSTIVDGEAPPTSQSTIVNAGIETTTTKRTTKQPKETSKSLLKQQIKLQEAFYKKQEVFLERQEAQRTQIIKILKDIRHIKEKKLTFEKEKWKAQQLINLNDFKQKAQSLELKERELNLKQQELEIRR